MKTLLLCLLLALPSFAQTVSYDKFKDQTTVSVSLNRIPTKKANTRSPSGVALIAGFVGKEPYIFTFRSYAVRSWQFIRNKDLTFLVDGERIPLGEGQWDGDTAKSYERITFTVDREVLAKIVGGKSVEFQLGPFEAAMKDDHKKELKLLLDYVVK